MPSKVEKFLRKLDAKRRAILDDILEQIECGDFASLDITKLQGEVNRYRVRKGNIRIQFSLDENRRAIEFVLDFRGENTY